jgi:lipid II:glycine glycyltransferase (peptidoglycan interpeptide bridge formation enzyme)
MGPAAHGPTAATLLHDDAAWDAFVAGQPNPPVSQLTAWARANTFEGWASTRVASTSAGGRQGAQLLLHRMRPGRWARAYAPHGPVGDFADRGSVAAFTEAIHLAARRAHLSHVLIDPELEHTDRLETWLKAEGWTSVSERPHRTRVVRLDQEETGILAGFEPRCRRSIAKGQGFGVRVVDGDEADLPTFHRLYEPTMRRAGRSFHTEGYFRSLWHDLAPVGRAHLLFAMPEGAGEPLAAVLLIGCGDRVADMFVGTTSLGEEQQAHHILKWGSMRRARAAGYREYDLYGLPNDGVALFKRTFGGRVIDYIGHWMLVTDPIGYHALRIARRVRGWRHRPDAVGAPAGL